MKNLFKLYFSFYSNYLKLKTTAIKYLLQNEIAYIIHNIEVFAKL